MTWPHIKLVRDWVGNDHVSAVVVRVTRNIGVSLRAMPDAEGTWWLSICAWYPTWHRARKSRTRLLGYRYGALPWFEPKWHKVKYGRSWSDGT